MGSLLIFLFWPLLILVFFSLLFIPAQIAFNSLASLVIIPSQLYRIATEPLLRKNHALEHATLNVIEEHYGAQPISGLARKDGFVLRSQGSSVSPHLIEEAAKTGLRRLQNGEERLAIHPRCGTSTAAANLMFSAVFLAVLFGIGEWSLPVLLVALVSINVLGPRIGQLLQRFLTTSSDVQGMEIVRVSSGYSQRGIFGALLRGGPDTFFVKTRLRPSRSGFYRELRGG